MRSSTDSIWIGFLHIPLATNNSYIQYRFIDNNQFNYPLSYWDDASFLQPDYYTPSPGWTSQSILGWADIGGGPNPWLHPTMAPIIGYYTMQTVNDTTLIGNSYTVFQAGHNPENGNITFSDTTGNVNFTDIRQTYYNVTFCACADSNKVGNGIGVMGNQQNHVDMYCSNNSKFVLKDISRRLHFNPDGHNGLMKDTASISTKIMPGDTLLANKSDSWVGVNQRSGIDAHSYTGKFYDFMRNYLLRNSYDSIGSSLFSYVEFSPMNDNAGYDPTRKCVIFGTVSSGKKSFAGCPDAVGHEWGHAITAHASNLRTDTGETAALNESFSDMTGVSFQSLSGGDPQWWRFGENHLTNGCAYRDLKEPYQPGCNRYMPDTYHGPHWDSNGDKYINMGVPNKMFYLLAAGDTLNGIYVQAIGVENAYKVMYKANKRFWSADIDFCNAKKKTVEAADSLDPTGSLGKWTAAAWNAVGVCPYVVGDANCNGECRGSDITYLVAALNGSESAKPNCICTDLNHAHIAFWVSADYNADCLIMGSDVTYAVRYFKGLGPAPVPCSSFNPNCP